MLTDSLRAFVARSLPPAPARVLEIGAGHGLLAAELREDGYDVVAIDPASEAESVLPVALADLQVEDGSFEAAVAVVSLHHVHPLEESCHRLAAAMRPDGVLVVDEVDVERVDERAATWWLEQRRALGHDPDRDARAWIERARTNIAPVDSVVAALAPMFTIGPLERVSYLHRWHLDVSLQAEEEAMVERGELPVVGVRFVARRLPPAPNDALNPR